MKRISFSILSLCLATLLWWGGFFGESVAQYVGEDYCDYGDLMQQAFCVANRKETIIDLGNTKNAVGTEIIKGSIEIDLFGGVIKKWVDKANAKDGSRFGLGKGVTEYLEDFEKSATDSNLWGIRNNIVQSANGASSITQSTIDEILQQANAFATIINAINWTTLEKFKTILDSKRGPSDDDKKIEDINEGLEKLCENSYCLLQQAIQTLNGIKVLDNSVIGGLLGKINQISGQMEKYIPGSVEQLTRIINQKINSQLDNKTINHLNVARGYLTQKIELTQNEVNDLNNHLHDVEVIPPATVTEFKKLITEKEKEINKFNSSTVNEMITTIESKKNYPEFITAKDFVDIKQNDSIIIRITRFILMLTIVLSVTMTIINGIIYITKSGNGEDPSKARWNLLYIAVGILLALFSVVIINLLRSVGGEQTLGQISHHQSISDTSHLV